MAAVNSRIPHAAATIVPFDVRSRVECLAGRGPMAKAEAAAAVPERAAGPKLGTLPESREEAAQEPVEVTSPRDSGEYARPKPAGGVTPIGSLTAPGRAIVVGRVHTVEIRPVEHNSVLACDVQDSSC